MSLKKILMLEREAMIILDNSNGGFNGVTKDFWTTDLRGGEVVRRDLRALQGGYVIDISKHIPLVPNGGEIYSPYSAIQLNGLIYPTGSMTKKYLGRSLINLDRMIDVADIEISAIWTGTELTQTTQAYNSDDVITFIGEASFNCDDVGFKINFHNQLVDEGLFYVFYMSSKNGDDPTRVYFQDHTQTLNYFANSVPPKPDSARAINIPIYQKIFKLPNVFFVKEKIGSLDSMINKFGIKKQIRQVQYLAKKLKKVNKCELRGDLPVCVLVKNSNRLEVNFLTFNLFGGGISRRHKKTINIYNNSVELYMFLNHHGICGCIDIDKRKNKIVAHKYGEFMDITSPSEYFENLLIFQGGPCNEPIHILAGGEGLFKDSYTGEIMWKSQKCNHISNRFVYNIGQESMFWEPYSVCSVFDDRNDDFWSGR